MMSSVHATASSGLIAKSKKLQEECSRLVIHDDFFWREPTNVCGIDVAYRKNMAYCSAVLMNARSLKILKRINHSSLVTNPYIPGYLMLRESETLLKTLESIKSNIDVLLIDGHGVLHPRRCGLASYIGVLLNLPTIGVAKTLLCGVISEDHSISINDIICGFQLVKENKKPIYISVGHGVKLETAIRIVYSLILPEERIPEPLRLADLFSKALARSSNNRTEIA
jgi:deoxyribonuclease V